mgnify:CR=1 FL=1
MKENLKPAKGILTAMAYGLILWVLIGFFVYKITNL